MPIDGDRASEERSSDAAVSATDQDRSDRLRAMSAAVEHREAIRRLRVELEAADRVDDVGRVAAEMNRVGAEYEAWLRSETIRTRAYSDQRAGQWSDTDTIA